MYTMDTVYILVAITLVVTLTGVTAHPGHNDRSQHPKSHHSTRPSQQKVPVDWMERGQQDLKDALNLAPKWTSARNVIMFIGDGLGISTLTPTRFLKAQRAEESIADVQLSWETFPYTGLIKTYNTDFQTPDSSGTATAFLSGVKTRLGVVGVNQNVPRGDCNMTAGNEVKSLIHYAMEDGKWAGIVTTTRLTHATPASAYAHAADRGWESDDDLLNDGLDPEKCWDIARQMVDNSPNKNIKVLLGGGRRHMMPNDTADPEYPDEMGHRQDGRDLRQDWLDIHQNMALPENSYKYVENKTDFDAIDVNTVDYLLGMFEYSHMKYEAERREETGDKWTEPSLAQMVKKSIDILKKGPDGYALLVEGGRIDHAHHDNNAYRALDDTLAMEVAVQVAMDETSEDDTLIIVTADHSHVFTMAGYQLIDTDIFGSVVDDDGLVMFDDDKPVLTLGYANGPGFYNHRTTNDSLENEHSRINLTNVDTTGKDYLQDASAPYYSESHGGEDVAVYARGPMSHLFVGQHEQSFIAHAAMYAHCTGWNKDLCTNPPLIPGCDEISGAPSNGLVSPFLAGVFTITVWLCRL